MKFIKHIALILLVISLQGCNSIEKKIDKLPKKALPKVVSASFPLQKKWQVKAGSGVGGSYAVLSPAINGNMVYFADHKGQVFAYNEHGKKLWENKLSTKVSAAVTIANSGLLLIGENKATLINTDDGSLVWESDLGSEVFALPSASEAHAYVHLLDGYIVAVDLSTGNIAWRYSAQTPSIVMRKSSSAVIKSNKLYTGLANGKVVALRLHDGSLYWEQEVGVPSGKRDIQRMADVSATPIVDDNTIYAAAYKGNLSALDLVTGRVLWQSSISTLNAGDIYKDALFFSDTKGHIKSYSKSTGRVNWNSDTLEGRMLTGPVVYKKNIFIGDEEGNLHVFDFKGDYISRIKLASAVTKAPVVQNGELLILTSNGTLHIFSN
ncbi:MAG: outer membrane protein assembly factor BamB [Francisellaceae bacterium]|jgi:outer membrane protein assembly factor BamB|nr:outer membrane protein assembly factor BamB [Francisellaceae bacterium]MBT6206478.1 outer membrane protein assembly factor BamB [Francisellaceae bacterium]MBT6539194.1 outer membrane protein assembly factor BamB [Francisellaceae bacterium]